jgi:hypothetical protein
MWQFSKNKTFASSDLYPLFKERPAQAMKVFNIVMRLLKEKKFFVPQPFKIFGISAIEECLRLFQSGRNSGKMVIEISRGDVVRVSQHLSRLSNF